MENAWSPITKRLVVVGSVVALFLLMTQVGAVIPPLIITFVLAFILSPVADLLSARLRLNRTLVVAIIYLILVAGIFTLPALFVPPLIRQIEGFLAGLPEFTAEIGELLQRQLIFGDFAVGVQDLYEQAGSSIQTVLSSLGTRMVDILTNIASGLIWMFFILVGSFYLVKDWANIIQWIDEVTPPRYRSDTRRLRAQIAASWNAFLRGQLVLSIVMGLIVGIAMALIGLPNALFIGMLFGLLEFIPNFGPIIASIPTVLLALIRGSTVLDISNVWFAVVVIGVNFLLQQLENNFLVPRIIGQSLNLHPVVVLVAAIMGANLAGVLGILLAAPLVATLRILAEYMYYRLLDMPPFPEQRAQLAQSAAATDEIEVDEARATAKEVERSG